MYMHTFYAIFVVAAMSTSLDGPIPAQVERVVDGDTIRVRADIWIDQSISVLVRVADIDAPEIFRPKCQTEKLKAREAKAFVADFVSSGNVNLYNIHNGKYAGRVVARIENSDGNDLAAALVAANHAVYGQRGTWCAAS